MKSKKGKDEKMNVSQPKRPRWRRGFVKKRRGSRNYDKKRREKDKKLRNVRDSAS